LKEPPLSGLLKHFLKLLNASFGIEAFEDHANSDLMTDKVTIDLVGEPQVWSRTASTPVAAC
jgi:hypothetical protein